MALEGYLSKRNFKHTPEPTGNSGKRKHRPLFVIQKHDASQLHYDFRLEIDGVLKSWAVPKGPSTDPSEKRLATPTEDHPMDYAEFEGVIPKGQYGGGTVMVWDAGIYRNLKDGGDSSLPEQYRDGNLSVWLEGEKIRGGYTLVRMKNSDDWLLVKHDDETADARRNPVSTEPDSVLTGRGMQDIAKQEGNTND